MSNSPSTAPRSSSRLVWLLSLLLVMMIVAVGIALLQYYLSYSYVVPSVRAILDNQAEAWNAGKLEEFMEPYLDNEDLRFYSADKITKGYEALKERYRKTYQAEGKEMGKLTFSEVDVVALGPAGALARGRWKVVTSKDTFEGLFTLTLQRTPRGWKIIHDHTSRKDPPPPS